MGENGEGEGRFRHDPEHMLEMAWGVIANASDWWVRDEDGSRTLSEEQSKQWIEAAERWRDNYHEWLDDSQRTFRLEQVARLLLAGDVQARVLTNPEAEFIEVSLTDGGKILWSRTNSPFWSFTIVDPDGEIHPRETGFPADLPVEEVAKAIATYDYPAPVIYPQPEEGSREEILDD